MAQTRKRAREAREAARAAEVAAAAERRERAARRKALVPKVALPRRRRRYGALPTLVLVRLLLVFLAVQLAVWLLIDGLGARLSLAVLTGAVLLMTTTWRNR